ncbi:MAG: MFS transporter [Halobacteriaceae archaeon]
MGRLGEALSVYRGFQRPVYAVVGARFVNVLGSGIVYPYFTIHFYEALQIPFSIVGLALLANNVMLATGTLAGGVLADRYGRRPIMVASMGSSAVTLAAYSVVRTGPVLIGVAAAAGFTAGLYAPASQAILADLTDSADRERAYGLLKVASNVGFGSGFVVGGVLYELARTSIFVLDGITSGVVAVLLFFILPRVHDGGDTSVRATVRGWTRAIARPRLLGLAGLNVLFAIAYAQMQSTVPAFATETLGMNSAEIGTLFLINPLTVVLLQLPVVAAVERWRRTRGLLLSTAFWAASFVAILLAYQTGTLVGIGLVGLFLFLRTMGENLHSPLVTSLASDMAEMETRGSQLSLLEVAKRLGFGIGPVIGGVFFDAGRDELLWPTLIGLCGLLAVGILALERTVSARENRGSST